MRTLLSFPFRPFPILGLCLLASVACSPEDKSTSSAAAPKRKIPILQELKVERRADGLAYLPGAQTPFTGDAIDLHHDRTPPRLAIRTPYREGRIDGVKTTWTSGGKLREERTYRAGMPLTCVVYHGNGRKKIDIILNERDLGEGPYKRWHDNGVLEAESTFDSEERFHGEEKDYDREGKLVGHYRKVHGRLVEILFETPEVKAERIAKWGPSLPGDQPSPPSSPAR
jgi:antitoxin component YwqK of YwqJK toxin-antitoxin module